MYIEKQPSKKKPSLMQYAKERYDDAVAEIKKTKIDVASYKQYIDEQSSQLLNFLDEDIKEFEKQLEVESERRDAFLNEILDSVKNGDISKLEKITSKSNEVK